MVNFINGLSISEFNCNSGFDPVTSPKDIAGKSVIHPLFFSDNGGYCARYPLGDPDTTGLLKKRKDALSCIEEDREWKALQAEREALRRERAPSTFQVTLNKVLEKIFPFLRTFPGVLWISETCLPSVSPRASKISRTVVPLIANLGLYLSRLPVTDLLHVIGLTGPVITAVANQAILRLGGPLR